jgi:hypothetical protein
MSVRSDEINGSGIQTVVGQEFANAFPEIMSQIDIATGVLQSRGVFERGETSAPVVGIFVCVGTEDFVNPFSGKELETTVC